MIIVGRCLSLLVYKECLKTTNFLSVLWRLDLIDFEIDIYLAMPGADTVHSAPMVARYLKKTSICLGARKFVLYERSNTKLKKIPILPLLKLL